MDTGKASQLGLWSIGSVAASPHDLMNAGTQSTLRATNKRQCLIQNQSRGSGIEEYVNKPASFFRISPQIRGQPIAPGWPSLSYRISISFARSRAANRAIQESLSPAAPLQILRRSTSSCDLSTSCNNAMNANMNKRVAERS